MDRHISLYSDREGKISILLEKKWLLIGIGLVAVGLIAWLILQPRFERQFNVHPLNTAWEIFTPADRAFQIAFPGKPEMLTESLEIDGQSVPSPIYRSVLTDGTSYLVRVVTYPPSVDLSNPVTNYRRMLNALVHAQPGNRLAAFEPISLAGQSAAHALLTNDRDQSRLDYHFLLIDRQFIILAAAAPAAVELDPAPFVQSFVLSPPKTGGA